MQVDCRCDLRLSWDVPSRRTACSGVVTAIQGVCREREGRRHSCGPGTGFVIQITEMPFRVPVAAVPPRENEGGRSASGLLVEGRIAMSDRDTFGPRLRAERERRGISLDTIAAVTNVSADLCDGLERNDVSRWPSGIFARSFVRDYARAIGLDEAEVVNDFCRLFPNGDRRARRLIEAHARIIGHKPKVDDQVGGLPLEGDRRAAA